MPESGPDPEYTLPEDVRQLVQAVHAAPGKLCIVVTGAGTGALAWLFAKPGTSRTVLDAQVPYAAAALDEFTGTRADQHVSGDEAMLMADRALERARLLSAKSGESSETLLAGVACTAAIATDRVRRGENRCHVAFAASDGRRVVISLVMAKGKRGRAGEENVTSRIVLNAVAEAKRVAERVKVQLVGDERLDIDGPEPHETI